MRPRVYSNSHLYDMDVGAVLQKISDVQLMMILIVPMRHVHSNKVHTVI